MDSQKFKSLNDIVKEVLGKIGEMRTSMDETLDAIDNARHKLCLLRDTIKSRIDKSGVPPELQCPISGSIMKDPVSLLSTTTFDEASIKKWLADGHKTSKEIKSLFETFHFVPNVQIKEIISTWRKENLDTLLEALSSSSREDKKDAATQICNIINDSEDVKAVLGEIRFDPLFEALFDEENEEHLDLLDKLLDVLELVSSHPIAINQLVHKKGAIRLLLNILKQMDIISEVKREQCLSILLRMFENGGGEISNDMSELNEDDIGGIIAATGSDRARYFLYHVLSFTRKPDV